MALKIGLAKSKNKMAIKFINKLLRILENKGFFLFLEIKTQDLATFFSRLGKKLGKECHIMQTYRMRKGGTNI